MTTSARPALEVTPSSLDFGSTTPGMTVTRTLTLRSVGESPVQISALALSGAAAADYAFSPATIEALGSGESATLEVRFTPTTPGVRAARLDISSDASNAPEYVVVLGGVAALADPCAGVTCDTPPGPCFEPTGTCVDGSCRWAPRTGQSCTDGDACTTADRCDATGVCVGTATVCDAPPAATCVDAQTLRTFEARGTCGASGACAYTAHESTCQLGCDAVTGACRSTCGAGLHECNAACVSNSSVLTCGAACSPCTAPAHGMSTCDGASCGFTCAQGFHACGAACADDTSVASCGSACTPCVAPANATPTCDGVSCGFVCNAGFHACGGACVPNTSTNSCGASCSPCSTPTNAAPTCDGTSCGYTCNAGFFACASGCCAGATAAAAGAQSCAVLAGGTVKCWGLGVTTPTAVSGLTGVAQVRPNGYWPSASTCVLTTQGGVKCWGRNNSGQLGDGTFDDRTTPVDTFGLSSGVRALAVGMAHACAVTAAGGVKCWGMNHSGQLGNGSTAVVSSTPVDVTGLSSGIVAVAAGDNFSCAVTSGGQVKCWGGGTVGQLGNGGGSDQPAPVLVSGISAATDVVADGLNACAIVSNLVRCWGVGSNGALGNGSTWGSGTPVSVSGLTNVTQVSVGARSGCAVANGGAYCWGANGNGQVGDGSTTDRLVPVPVSGLSSGVVSVSTREGRTCALLTTGEVRCWGWNAHGGVGDGTTTDRWTPVPVVGL